MIQVNANKIVEPIHNFWNNLHFHPTDAIEDEWGKDILDCVSRDKVAQYVRMYAMLEDIVTRDENGNLQYDFTDTDTRIDYMVSRGFGLLICMNFLPNAIAKDPTCISEAVRYKGKRLTTSVPKDYRDWQEICAVYVRHLLERYGEELVNSWYFHCWNEPNGPGYWMSNEPDWYVRTEEYIKLYDYFAEGIKSVSKKLKIGGPSAAFNLYGGPVREGYTGEVDMEFIARFFKHLKSGTNYANGGIGTEIDFYSMHCYGKGRNFDRLDPLYAYEVYCDQYRVAVECGFGDLEVIADEWEATGGGFVGQEKYPNYFYRNTEIFSAHFFALIDYYLQRHVVYSHMMICLSGQHDQVKEFTGVRTFVTKSGFKPPIYNGYVLAAMLGNQKLACENDTKVGVIPTMDEQGNVIVALYNYSSDFTKKNGSQHVGLNISLPEGTYTVTHYRLDADNCNSHTAWQKLGKPEVITQNEREAIRSAERMKPWYPAEEFTGSTYTDNIIMTDYAVSLIKFTKK